MKTLKVPVAQDTYDRVRAAAERRHVSMAEVVRECLDLLPPGPAAFSDQVRREAQIRQAIGAFSAAPRLSRDELYEPGL